MTSPMQQLASQLSLDAKLTFRHRFVHVVVIMAVLFGLLVRFALPDELAHPSLVWIHDAARPFANEEARLLGSEEELRRKLVDDKDAIGLSLDARDGLTLLLRGSEEERSRALARTEAEVTWLKLRGQELAAAHDVVSLRPPVPPRPLSLSMLPVLLGIDVVFMGFLFAAVLLLQERTFGTVRFFRTSPSSTSLYIASKSIVDLGLSFLGTLLLFAIAMPRGLKEPWLWAFVAMGSLTMTFFGMGLASFFRGLSGFFYPMMVASMAASLPIAGYLMPTLDLGPLELLPTWQVMFGVREALFPTGASDALRASFATLSLIAVLAAAFAIVAVRRRVMEVRS